MDVLAGNAKEDEQWAVAMHQLGSYRCSVCGHVGTKDDMRRHRADPGLCRNRVMPQCR